MTDSAWPDRRLSDSSPSRWRPKERPGAADMFGAASALAMLLYEASKRNIKPLTTP
jgi:hypothetical protein